MIITILAAIFAIFFVILLHELGHFFVARWCGVKVLKFSIGFGKALWSYQAKSGTQYVIAMLPLGGYVKMLDDQEEPIPPAEREFSFPYKPLWKRMAIVIAGPLTNFLLAIVMFAAVFMVGVQQLKPVIDKVAANSIAAQAGIEPGAEIISIDNKKVSGWGQIVTHFINHIGSKDNMKMLIRNREGLTAEKNLSLQNWQVDLSKEDPLLSVGITPSLSANIMQTKRYNILSAWWPAFKQTTGLFVLNAVVLAKMIMGKISLRALSGPISIFQVAGKTSQIGITAYLGFIGFLSVTLSFVNILPIPALDGGHLLFQVIEGIMGRPVSKKTQIVGLQIGVFLLLLLIVQATYNDLVRLFA
jgi:regulator of sigma E protease